MIAYKPCRMKVKNENADGAWLDVLIPDGLSDVDRERYSRGGGVLLGELVIWDGRSISPMQRKKVYALFADIGAFTGYGTCREGKEDRKSVMKAAFMARTGLGEF